MILGSSGLYYPYVFGIRLGSFGSLEEGRETVERYVKLAEPFINAIVDRKLP